MLDAHAHRDRKQKWPLLLLMWSCGGLARDGAGGVGDMGVLTDGRRWVFVWFGLVWFGLEKKIMQQKAIVMLFVLSILVIFHSPEAIDYIYFCFLSEDVEQTIWCFRKKKFSVRSARNWVDLTMSCYLISSFGFNKMFLICCLRIYPEMCGIFLIVALLL